MRVCLLIFIFVSEWISFDFILFVCYWDDSNESWIRWIKWQIDQYLWLWMKSYNRTWMANTKDMFLTRFRHTVQWNIYLREIIWPMRLSNFRMTNRTDLRVTLSRSTIHIQNQHTFTSPTIISPGFVGGIGEMLGYLCSDSNKKNNNRIWQCACVYKLNWTWIKCMY